MMQTARPGTFAGCSLLGSKLALPTKNATNTRDQRHVVRASGQDEEISTSRRDMLATAAALAVGLNAPSALAKTAAPKAPDPYEVSAGASRTRIGRKSIVDSAD